VKFTKRFVNTLIEIAPEFDLACIGTSIYGLGAATIESLRYISHARIVYCYPVTRQHAAVMRSLNRNIVDLNDSHYLAGRKFEVAYSEIITEILRAASDGGRVVYAQQGSPTFLAYTSVQLLKLASAEGLRVVAVPGVSSFECLLTYLAPRFDLSDVQLYNCSSIASGAVSIDRRIPCLCFNLARYASGAIGAHAEHFDPALLDALIRKLAQFYEEDHPVFMNVVEPSGSVSEIQTSVQRLNRDLAIAPPNATLFLPGND